MSRTCKQCNDCIEHKRKDAVFCSRECRSTAYQQTDKSKAMNKAYQKSDKYKAYKKAYQQSDKGKATQKAYDQSDERKAKNKAYKQTDKYKASRKAYRETSAVDAEYRWKNYQQNSVTAKRILDMFDRATEWQRVRLADWLLRVPKKPCSYWLLEDYLSDYNSREANNPEITYQEYKWPVAV